MSETQNIKDWFNRMAKRDPTADEMARFTDTSEYYIRSYLRSLAEYNTSNEYQERWAQIVEMHQKIFGYDPGARYVDYIIRNEISDSQMLFGMRNSQAYKTMFAGKPVWMSEDQYRKIYDEKELNKEGISRAFSAYAGKKLSDDDINKIFFGGPGSEAIRREYARVKSLQASMEATRGGLLGSAVKITPQGPVQQMMQGREATAPVRAAAPANEGEPERWASYDDYKAGKTSPSWDDWWNSGGRATPSP